jgi:hypothetical protein
MSVLADLVQAYSAATASRRVDHRQAGRDVFVEFPLRFVKRIILTATRRRCGTHNVLDAYLGSLNILSGDAVTDVALGDDADEIETFFILNHRGTTASRMFHCLSGVQHDAASIGFITSPQQLIFSPLLFTNCQ